MTLIAFATYGQRAEVLTDTPTYATSLRTMGHCSKLMPLPHIDAVMLTQGDHHWGNIAKLDALALSEHLPDVDQLGKELPNTMRTSWRFVTEETPHAVPVIGVLIGYSPEQGRFTAYGYTSDEDFEPFEIRGLFVHPAPFSVRPSDWELRHLADVAHPDDVDLLRHRPKADKPANADEWVDLAVACRQSRSLAPVRSGMKVIVGGRVYHTKIRRGHMETNLVHTFDDSGEEWSQVIEGTMHPQSQLGPCWCGSEKRFIDCHMPLDDPCHCQSGKATRDCCAITSQDREAATA